MKRFTFLMIGILCVAVLSTMNTPVGSQDVSSNIAPPNIVQSVDDQHWHIVNVITLGEKSCVSVIYSEDTMIRCYNESTVSISDTIAIPDGQLNGDKYATRISFGNGAIECLLFTSSYSDIDPLLSCSNDTYFNK